MIGWQSAADNFVLQVIKSQIITRVLPWSGFLFVLPKEHRKYYIEKLYSIFYGLCISIRMKTEMFVIQPKLHFTFNVNC